MEAVRFFSQNPDASIKTVMRKFSISQATAYRLRKKALAESGRNSNKDFDSYLQKHDTKLPPNLQGFYGKKSVKRLIPFSFPRAG